MWILSENSSNFQTYEPLIELYEKETFYKFYQLFIVDKSAHLSALEVSLGDDIALDELLHEVVSLHVALGKVAVVVDGVGNEHVALPLGFYL